MTARTIANRAAWVIRAGRRAPFHCPPRCAEGHTYRWPCAFHTALDDSPLVVLSPLLSRFVHNVVAHPLLELWPGVGEWLHDRTDPTYGAPDDQFDEERTEGETVDTDDGDEFIPCVAPPCPPVCCPRSACHRSPCSMSGSVDIASMLEPITKAQARDANLRARGLL